MERHYGKGVRSCPMDGMLMPELVNGELETMHEEIVATSENQVLEAKTPSTCHPLLPDGWHNILHNMSQMKLSTSAVLQAKTKF